ncbi:MAG: hypothetical protein ABI895_09870 [Deltaproteobacteria bacterium]
MRPGAVPARGVLLALALAAAGCGRASAPAHAPAPVLPSAEPRPTPPAPTDTLGEGEPCGALDCRRFDDAASALRYVLRGAPLVLGIGEAHAPAGSEDLPTTAARFSDQLLPVLQGRASHLIVELLTPNRQCPRAAAPVEQAQKPVIAAQSRQNQSDYLTLGVRARALGIEPFVLTPSCEEFRAIKQAGDDAILATLSTIATITTRMAKGALLQNSKAGNDRMVVAYGGALHNDLGPSDTRASFRYGDVLNDFTAGRYIALDLIVRELIKDNAAWRALPWYGKLDPTSAPQSCILLSPSPQSYVLFFPGAAPRAPSG